MKGFDVLIKLLLKLPKFGKLNIIAQIFNILSFHLPKLWNTKIEIVAMLLDMSSMSFEGSNSMANDVDLEKDHITLLQML
jgi:hypothetical protein